MRYKDHSWLFTLLAGLATWRLASIIHSERIAAPLRKMLGVVEVGDDQEYWAYPDTFVGDLISCFWCVSWWAGLIVTVILLVFPVALLPFALSAVAILVKHVLDGDVWIEQVDEEDNADVY